MNSTSHALTTMRRLDDGFFTVGPSRQEGFLERTGGHRIFWQDSGNVEGIPLVIVHGGPGGQTSDGYRRLCDENVFRIVQFDQRGCGRSSPTACIEQNTLEDLVADMEAIRQHLDIDRWAVAGGSWGSTLSLAYAEAFPQCCLGLLLISTWLLRRQDIDWWFHGVKTVFPELWDAFAGMAPESERHDLKGAYRRMIFGEDSDLSKRAARSLYLYEEGFMHFDAPLAPADEGRGENYGRIFMHYAGNDFFLRENQLLAEATRIAHLPAILVTGRYDMCTPPNNAYDLARQLPRAELRIVPGAGHYPTEQAMASACVRASEDLYRRLSTASSGEPR